MLAQPHQGLNNFFDPLRVFFFLLYFPILPVVRGEGEGGEGEPERAGSE